MSILINRFQIIAVIAVYFLDGNLNVGPCVLNDKIAYVVSRYRTEVILLYYRDNKSIEDYIIFIFVLQKTRQI